jgi:predicted O-methyltransferase YrrM
MRLACFTMMKNESALISPFLDQLATFFDYSAILDHSSLDNAIDIIGARSDPSIEVFSLESTGYPQSQAASFFARKILKEADPEFLFFLDCDEFLPFDTREELIDFLSDKTHYHYLTYYWKNISPDKFDGSNIFQREFFQCDVKSNIPKIILGRKIAEHPHPWFVHQGYHGIGGESAYQLLHTPIPWSLIHIPIQSRLQFYFKITAGSIMLKSEAALLRNRHGYHWMSLAQQAAAHEPSDADLRAIALGYPDKLVAGEYTVGSFDFGFPYIKSEYNESAPYLSAQARTILRLSHKRERANKNFAIKTLRGNILMKQISERLADLELSGTTEIPSPRLALTGEQYSALIEPLFKLPTKLPITAWAGHIPFLFVLFRLLRPTSYVELGVHNGASFIGACSAAATYNLETEIVGVDTWEGDAHAGFYNGETTYQELKTYLDAVFPKARLERRTFLEAAEQFEAESIDILHIDGLHTYDAVKEDFLTWQDRLSPSGIVLFHDISVFGQGFGVHRLWEELKPKFATFEFHHSAGLGVLTRDEADPRLKALRMLQGDASSWTFYQNLVADIADTLKERMTAYAPAPSPAPPPTHQITGTAQKVTGMKKFKREVLRIVRRR